MSASEKQKYPAQNKVGLEVLVNVARSFNDIATESIVSDVSMVILGFSVVFCYVQIMLGKFSFIKNRVRKD